MYNHFDGFSLAVRSFCSFTSVDFLGIWLGGSFIGSVAHSLAQWHIHWLSGTFIGSVAQSLALWLIQSSQPVAYENQPSYSRLRINMYMSSERTKRE